MRVISGIARGIQLSSVSGLATRPTSDRVKESLFNIIRSQIPNSDFLDLFAGNGGIGIEALSRGAKSVVFVDSNPACVQTIKKNLAKTRLAGGEVYVCDVNRSLQIMSRQGRSFDIIFLDPPYGKGFVQSTLKSIEELKLLNQTGIIVAEYGKKQDISSKTSKIFQVREERYGDTKLGFFAYKEA